MAFAMVFPGQGSQSVGMLSALLDAEPAAAAALEQADAVLGLGLVKLVRAGPADQLNRTEFTQPAMLAAGVAAWRAWEARGGPQPAAVAGHSLGEFTAMVCAGAMSYEDALRIVRLRAELMQQAAPEGQGAMAAVLGLDDEEVIAACKAAEAEGGVAEAVNFNAPGQVVIAGDSAALARALQLAKAAGARRALALPVSVPCHCRLLDPVEEHLRVALAEVPMATPAIPVFHNIDAVPRQAPEALREALAEQVRSPVRWVRCVEAMRDAGATLQIEAGPGRVLTGLARRIDRGITALPADDPETLASALAAVRESENG